MPQAGGRWQVMLTAQEFLPRANAAQQAATTVADHQHGID